LEIFFSCAHLVHGLGDDFADHLVVVGAYGAHLGDFVAVLGGMADLIELLDHRFHGLVDAALELHGVVSRGHQLYPLPEYGLCQHGGGGGAVPGDVAGLAGHLAHHLGAHVLELVLQLDFLGDGDAVLGHGGRTEGFVYDNIPSLRAQGYFHGVRQLVYSLQNGIPGFLVKLYDFRHYLIPPRLFLG